MPLQYFRLGYLNLIHYPAHLTLAVMKEEPLVSDS